MTAAAFADAPANVETRQIWQIVALIALTLAVLFARRPDQFLHPYTGPRMAIRS